MVVLAARSSVPLPSANADAPGSGLPELIPLDVLFGNPERLNPQLSPDGTLLAYAAPDARGILQVWLRDLAGEETRVLTSDQKRGIRTFQWAADNAHLLYLQDRDGDENWHIYAVDVAAAGVGTTGGAAEPAQARDLTPFEGV